MARFAFPEVAIRGCFSWKDAATGKRRTKTKKFWATVNPFNKNSDGSVRTREDIIAILEQERDEWIEQMKREVSGE